MPSLTGIFQEPGQAAALLASQIQDAFSSPPPDLLCSTLTVSAWGQA